MRRALPQRRLVPVLFLAEMPAVVRPKHDDSILRVSAVVEALDRSARPWRRQTRCSRDRTAPRRATCLPCTMRSCSSRRKPQTSDRPVECRQGRLPVLAGCGPCCPGKDRNISAARTSGCADAIGRRPGRTASAVRGREIGSAQSTGFHVAVLAFGFWQHTPIELALEVLQAIEGWPSGAGIFLTHGYHSVRRYHGSSKTWS